MRPQNVCDQGTLWCVTLRTISPRNDCTSCAQGQSPGSGSRPDPAGRAAWPHPGMGAAYAPVPLTRTPQNPWDSASSRQPSLRCRRRGVAVPFLVRPRATSPALVSRLPPNGAVEVLNGGAGRDRPPPAAATGPRQRLAAGAAAVGAPDPGFVRGLLRFSASILVARLTSGFKMGARPNRAAQASKSRGLGLHWRPRRRCARRTTGDWHR